MNRYLCLLVTILSVSVFGQDKHQFPDEFLFGTGTSAYQIEGAWNEDGKGENIWDNYTHKYPTNILDGSNGDIACDSYHKYEEDVALLKELGVHFYRFSISWSRILPKGFAYKVNNRAIDYYNSLIDLLLKNDIIPMVTMFHWDTPQPIDELGGFASSLVVDWFEDYARVLFDHFGDRVKFWTTFNEPLEICKDGLGINLYASSTGSLSGIGDYMCGHNVLKSHARVYHMYKNIFKPTQKGKVSISLSSNWYEPATNSPADIDAAERALEFSLAWFADPIYHPSGDYPKSMKRFIAERSKEENFPVSRLPDFTKEELKYIKGTFDFFALNHYTTKLAAHKLHTKTANVSYNKDRQVTLLYDPKWPGSAAEWLKVVPWGFRKLLKWINDRYGNLEIMIAENGFADRGETDDQERINYHNLYLRALLESIHEDKVNVTAYTAWSLMDNFEWRDGYVYKFGLHHVDFSDPNRKRTPKSSAKYYKDVIATRRVSANRSSSTKSYPNTSLFIIITITAIVFRIPQLIPFYQL